MLPENLHPSKGTVFSDRYRRSDAWPPDMVAG